MQIADMIDGPIKMVTFDLYDTLVEADPPGWVRFQTALRHLNIEVSEAESLRGYLVGQEFYTVENGRLPIRDRGPDGIKQFRIDISRVTMLELGLPTDDDTVRQVQQRFEDESQPNKTYRYVAYDEVTAVLDRLRKHRILCGVISNADRDVTKLCLQAGFAEQMDILITSALVGWEKPDPRTFYAAIEPFNIAASDVLHVGDQIGSDIAGARAVGMAAALIDRHNFYAGTDIDGERVTSLSQLVDIVLEYNASFS